MLQKVSWDNQVFLLLLNIKASNKVIKSRLLLWFLTGVNKPKSSLEIVHLPFSIHVSTDGITSGKLKGYLHSFI